MPSSATFRSWASRVPPGFTFAVKASRYLTHIRRLRDPREPVEYLMERASELGDRLGPVLLQLPPDLEVDVDGLAETLDAFPRSTRVAVEPRHRSWYTDDVREVLTDRGVALCLADRRRLLMPEWQTADWAYLRFHGGRGARRRVTARRRWRPGPIESSGCGGTIRRGTPTSTTTMRAVRCGTRVGSPICSPLGRCGSVGDPRFRMTW